MSATHPTSEEEEESSFHDFDVSDLDESEAASVLSDNKYIANIMNNLFLSILQPPHVTARKDCLTFFWLPHFGLEF
jgi:hypothetical protein